MPHTLSPAPCNLKPPSERHYNSDLSIWLSVDPMADKYPSTSPYAYCANNPVRLVDPNGREWYINEEGYIKRGENDDDHHIYFVKGQGEHFGTNQVRSNNSVVKINIKEDANRGISESSGVYKKDGAVHPYESQYFSISDEEVARQVFTAASRYTDVEWSFWRDNDGIYLSTSHKKDTEVTGSDFAGASADKGHLQYYFHSHPRKEAFGAYSNNIDNSTYRNWKEKNPKLIFGIMYRGTLYDGTIPRPFKMTWDGTIL